MVFPVRSGGSGVHDAGSSVYNDSRHCNMPWGAIKRSGPFVFVLERLGV